MMVKSAGKGGALIVQSALFAYWQFNPFMPVNRVQVLDPEP